MGKGNSPDAANVVTALVKLYVGETTAFDHVSEGYESRWAAPDNEDVLRDRQRVCAWLAEGSVVIRHSSSWSRLKEFRSAKSG